MPKIDVYDINGKKVKELELNEAVFGIEPNEAVVHSVLVNFLANQRQGTQSTKTRSEVSGGGRKPWRQKGTGRARQGSIRAPQWIKGGIALGPKPRSYKYTVNKKERQLAVKSVLSSKVLENELVVVDSLPLNDIKTKEMVKMLENIKAQIAKHYQSISDRDAYVTANKVKNAYHGFGDRYKTLIAAFDYHADSIKARIGRDRAQRTYDRLMEERRCLMRYLVLKKLEDVTLKELDVTFIERYYAWMLSDGHCGKTTAFKRTQTLKCVLYVAVEQGWIDRHPFLAFKCAPDYKPRMFLSDEEIQRLMDIELRYHRQRAVRDMFIFCCFTGLAYIDLKNLTYDHIVTTPTGEQYIYNRRQKTGTPYHIMLLPIAQELIERYRGYPGKIDETRVFPVKDRKSMCTTIKRIAQKCGITKNLSTHIGRHTFGTTVTLEKGVPIETVSEMLGHKQITTTQIYAKLTANKMKEDVRLLTQRIGNLYELTQPTTRLLSKEA